MSLYKYKDSISSESAAIKNHTQTKEQKYYQPNLHKVSKAEVALRKNSLVTVILLNAILLDS